jgi:hypothetical protein
MQVGVLGIVEERAKSFVGRPLDEDHHRTWRDVRFAFLNPIQPAERYYASAVLADCPADRREYCRYDSLSVRSKRLSA